MSRAILTAVPLPITLPVVPTATALPLALTSRTEVRRLFRRARRAYASGGLAARFPPLRPLARWCARALRAPVLIAIADEAMRVALSVRPSALLVASVASHADRGETTRGAAPRYSIATQ